MKTNPLWSCGTRADFGSAGPRFNTPGLTFSEKVFFFWFVFVYLFIFLKISEIIFF